METTKQLIKERRQMGETDYEIVQLLIIERSMSAFDAMCEVGLTSKEGSIIRTKDYIKK